MSLSDKFQLLEVVQAVASGYATMNVTVVHFETLLFFDAVVVAAVVLSPFATVASL